MSRYSGIAGFLVALAMLTAVVGLAVMTGIFRLPGDVGSASPTPLPAASATPLVTPTPAPTPSPEPTMSDEPATACTPGGTYIVQEGDYLFLIGEACGVPWELIAEANQIAGPGYVIVPGQDLQIPVPPSPDPNTYIVQPGDSIQAIALSLGVDATELADCNALPDWNDIYPGQVLTIPPFCPAASPSPSPSATRRR